MDHNATAHHAIERHEQGRLEEAEPLYRRYLEAVPDDPAILHLLGMLRLERGDVREARGLIGAAIEAAPAIAEYRYHLGLILETQDETDAALAAYLGAVEIDPDALEPLLHLARALRRTGRNAEAAAHLARALTRNDRYGIVAEQVAALEADGRPGDALDVLDGFCRRHPRDAQALHVLGALALRGNDTGQAQRALEQAVAADPGMASAHNDLGALHFTCGRFEAAAGCLTTAVELDGGYTSAHFNLGSSLEKLARYDDAAVHYRQAIALDPGHEASYRNLAALYYKTGDSERRTGVLEQLLARRPDDVRARHMLAAARGEGVDGTPPEYVRTLFDAFANDYDGRLAGISYRGPALLELALGLLEPSRQRRVLDAGCGTGLCAPVLAPYARTLIGVDLSPGMLDAARARGHYDALHEADIVAFMAARAEPFGLIAVIDTFVYLGGLADAFDAAAGALSPDGLLVFTVESLDAGDGYALHASGRFQHSAQYLRIHLDRAGLEVVLLEEAHLRLELGEPVTGYLAGARKPR